MTNLSAAMNEQIRWYVKHSNNTLVDEIHAGTLINKPSSLLFHGHGATHFFYGEN